MNVMVQLLNGPQSAHPDTIGEYGPYDSFEAALTAHKDDNDDVARVVLIYDSKAADAVDSIKFIQGGLM